ncbi:hypothetical protein [Natronorubrum halophilum]|uniref:hypothetical protein n=1 Tax=Natronorubrum halophilum TaxID=1702106 RepID=UPI0010C1A287|nr:hypothetical protein [Natronorubrum halophilum]
MTVSRSTRLLGFVALGLGAAGIVAVLWAEPARASNVAAGLGEDRELAVPTWLTLLTGGAAVGASAMLAALVTDRQFVETIHEWAVPLPAVGTTTALSSRTIAIGAAAGNLLGLAALAAVVVVGLEGPAMPTANFAVVLTFVGVRALLPMIAVLVVNPWPAIDPFRTIARCVIGVGARVRADGRVRRDERTEEDERTGQKAADGSGWGLLEYPTRISSWPAVLGLGTLVWLELVLPVTSDPGTLALVVVGYGVVTVAGAILFSPAAWFRHADPLAALFRLYGTIAPIQRRNDQVSSRHRDGQVSTRHQGGQVSTRHQGGRFRLVAPGARLRDSGIVTDSSEVAFVVLVVWELTFNGFIVTRPGRRTIETVVTTGVSAPVAYLLVLAGGFGLALAFYRLAAHASRRTAPTYLSKRVLARRFAPSLLAIAAGYHVAHYVAFVVSLTPASLAVLSNPLAPPVNPTTLVVPDWLGTVEIGALIAGHILAIWTAHAIAYDCFPGRLQAIRSQYPFVVVMVCYTVISLWLLTLPATEPVYVTG